MRIEGLVGRTLRAQPAGLSAPMGMAARGGFVRAQADGWVVLPLGVRVLDRLAAVIQEGLGCQTVSVASSTGTDLREVLAGLISSETQSYRHLPLRIATRMSAGVLSGQASQVLRGQQLFALSAAFAEADSLAAFMTDGLANVNRVARVVGMEIREAVGVGESGVVLAMRPDGESVVLSCPSCGTTHLREAAPFARSPLEEREAAKMERVHTPGASTIQALAEMLSVGPERTLKALVVASGSGELIFAVLRGDLEATMEKLADVTGCSSLRPATDEEIMASGAVPGFASPIGLRVKTGHDPEGLRVIADPSVFTGSDFVAGANAPDYHYIHVNPRRDLTVSQVSDIALAPSGAQCAACGAVLAEQRGRPFARRFRLPGPRFADESGAERTGVAGCLLVDALGLFEEVVRACSDEVGIAWPLRLAPAAVHVISLRADSECQEVVNALEASGIDVLVDDRPLGAGVKFADADLIGCPLRVTVSERSLKAGGVELSGRRGLSAAIVPRAGLVEAIRDGMATLMSS